MKKPRDRSERTDPKKLREDFYKWADSFPTIDPCPGCGRLVLAGPPCCETMAKRIKERKERTP